MYFCLQYRWTSWWYVKYRYNHKMRYKRSKSETVPEYVDNTENLIHQPKLNIFRVPGGENLLRRQFLWYKSRLFALNISDHPSDNSRLYRPWGALKNHNNPPASEPGFLWRGFIERREPAGRLNADVAAIWTNSRLEKDCLATGPNLLQLLHYKRNFQEDL